MPKAAPLPQGCRGGCGLRQHQGPCPLPGGVVGILARLAEIVAMVKAAGETPAK